MECVCQRGKGEHKRLRGRCIENNYKNCNSPLPGDSVSTVDNYIESSNFSDYNINTGLNGYERHFWICFHVENKETGFFILFF